MANVDIKPVFWLTVVVLFAAVSGAEDPAPVDVGALARAITDAADVSAAGRAYVAARQQAADQPAVYEAYVNRLLALGQPRLAYLPALELLKLKKEHPIALGVVGYTHAAKSNLPEAYDAFVRAAAGAPSNEGILYDVAMIIAWQEAERAQVSLEARRMVSKNLRDWRRREDFQKGKAAADSAIKARTDRVTVARENLKLLAKDEQDLKNDDEILKKYHKARGDAQTYHDRMRGAEMRIKGMQAGLERAGASRQSMLTGIEQSKRDVIEYKRKYILALREIRSLASSVKRHEKKIADAQRRVKSAEKKLASVESTSPSFKWLPPAVDGKVVPEGSVRIMRRPPRPPTTKPAAGGGGGSGAGPSTGGGKTAPPAGPSAADRKPKMAGMMLRNGRRDVAIRMYKEIIEKYPDTPAAAAADKALSKLFAGS